MEVFTFGQLCFLLKGSPSPVIIGNACENFTQNVLWLSKSPAVAPCCFLFSSSQNWSTNSPLSPGCVSLAAYSSNPKVIADILSKCLVFGFLGAWDSRRLSTLSRDPVGFPLSLGRVQEKGGGHLAGTWLGTGQGAKLACSLLSPLIRHRGWCLCPLSGSWRTNQWPFPYAWGTARRGELLLWVPSRSLLFYPSAIS